MIALTRSALVRMISVRRRSSARQRGRLGEELSGMTHGADGIADFVGDARAQPAQSREFRLLHFLGEHARVFQEDHYRRGIGCSQRREVRADRRAAVGGNERRVGTGEHAGVAFFLPPGLQKIEQLRRGLANQRVGDRRCRHRGSGRPTH